MHRFAYTMMVVTCLVAGVAGLSRANFGGDDTGTIPSDAPKGPITKCDGTVGKAAAKFAAAVIKCHAGRAAGKLADPLAEEACEDAAAAQLRATKTTGCLPCTDLAALAASIEVFLDEGNVQIYCGATGSPFGGDDLGVIPSNAAEAKCDGGVGKAVGKLIGAVVKCHASQASGKLVDDAAEDACEAKAVAKLTSLKTTGCAACTNLPNLATLVVDYLDAGNQLIYCATTSTTAASTTTTTTTGSTTSTVASTTATTATSTTASTTTTTVATTTTTGPTTTLATTTTTVASSTTTTTIGTCTQGTTRRTFSINFGVPDTSVLVQGLTLLVDYPETRVTISGTGTAVGSAIINKQSGALFQPNDLESALRMVIAGTAAPLNPQVRLFTINFFDCVGAQAPTPADFTCTVESATDPFGLPDSGVTCSVTTP